MTTRNQTSGTSTSRTQTVVDVGVSIWNATINASTIRDMQEVSYGGIRTIDTDEQRTIDTGALRTINIPDTIRGKITNPSTSWTIA